MLLDWNSIDNLAGTRKSCRNDSRDESPVLKLWDKETKTFSYEKGADKEK